MSETQNSDTFQSRPISTRQFELDVAPGIAYLLLFTADLAYFDVSKVAAGITTARDINDIYSGFSSGLKDADRIHVQLCLLSKLDSDVLIMTKFLEAKEMSMSPTPVDWAASRTGDSPEKVTTIKWGISDQKQIEFHLGSKHKIMKMPTGS